MNNNPFLKASKLNLPLSQDNCQQIHFSALRAAANGLQQSSIPAPVAATYEFLRQNHLYGGEAYLVHPADVDRIFSGVTLAVYKTIEELYCCRLERSVQTIYQILNKMAIQAGVPPLEYEAAWAICLYLEERRQANSDVTTERVETIWQVIRLNPDVNIQNGSDVYRPTLVCVLDVNSSRILSFRVARDEGEIEESAGLAIYDAIVSQRIPAQDGVAGLVWRLPARLATKTNLPQDTQKALSRMGIRIEPVCVTGPLLESLRGNWDADLADRILQKNHFNVIFDNYLQKIHGYGPRHTQQNLKYEFAHLIGYNRDPAWQFPTLRQLLPPRSTFITADGKAEYDGLHYEDKLLAYWPRHQIVLRRSEEAEAVAWVYLAGQILCQAMALELRRRDGSYRPNRPGRD